MPNGLRIFLAVVGAGPQPGAAPLPCLLAAGLMAQAGQALAGRAGAPPPALLRAACRPGKLGRHRCALTDCMPSRPDHVHMSIHMPMPCPCPVPRSLAHAHRQFPCSCLLSMSIPMPMPTQTPLTHTSSLVHAMLCAWHSSRTLESCAVHHDALLSS
jgi:hypothetical protein